MLHAKFWEKYFTNYDLLNTIFPYQNLLSSLVKELDIKKDEKILDAGAGTGNLSIYLVETGSSVYALDNSIAGINILKNKSKKIHTYIHDLCKPLPFPNNFFDKIVSNNVIYTIPKEKRAAIYKEFYRVLKPGGKIVISNIIENWDPKKIYFSAVENDIKKCGIIVTVVKIFRLIIPTVKIFYYNGKIKKEGLSGDYSFLTAEEQKNLFIKAGFTKVSEPKALYANQAVMNSAYK